MKIIDVEIYINQFIDFFEKNPNDLLVLIGEVKKNEFYSKVKEQCVKNYKNNDDVTLTKQQIIDIVVELKVPELNDRLKIEKHIFKTKFGDIILN